MGLNKAAVQVLHVVSRARRANGEMRIEGNTAEKRPMKMKEATGLFCPLRG